jgi:hypothetical protein
MIPCGEAPSNQSELGLGQKGDLLMQQAREWVRDNPDHWERYKRLARYMERGDDRPSPNFIRELTRHGFELVPGGIAPFARLRVSVRNSLAPCLARIAMEEDGGIKFRLARSSADGFAEVAL